MASRPIRLNGATSSLHLLRNGQAFSAGANGVAQTPCPPAPARSSASLPPPRAQPSDVTSATLSATSIISPSGAPESLHVTATDHHASSADDSTSKQHSASPAHATAEASGLTTSSGSPNKVLRGRAGSGAEAEPSAAAGGGRDADAVHAYEQIVAEVNAADAAAIADAFASSEGDSVSLGSSGAGKAGRGRRKRTTPPGRELDGAAAPTADTTSASADATAATSRAGRRKRGSSSTSSTAAADIGVAVTTSAAGQDPISSEVPDDDSAPTQRSRVADVRARLLRAMRSATVSPRADSINLVLAPLKPHTQSLEDAAAAAAPGSFLRAEAPLPMEAGKAKPEGKGRGKGRSAKLEEDEEKAGKAVGRGSGGAGLREGGRGRTVPRKPLEGRFEGRGAFGARQGQEEEDGERPGEQAKPRVLLPGARQRRAGRDWDEELRRDATAERGGRRRLFERDVEDERPFEAGAPRTRRETFPSRRRFEFEEDEGVRGGRRWASREDERAEMERQGKLRRSNEEFARYVEGMAASVEAAASASSRLTGGGGSSGSRAEFERKRAERERERQEQEQRQRQREEQQKQQRNQAEVLRGLADMFRNFAAKAGPPAAAAAAVVAAVTPAAAEAAASAVAAATATTTATKEAGQPDRDTPPSFFNPFSFFGGGGRRANDVQLILQPVKSEWTAVQNAVRAEDLLYDKETDDVEDDDDSQSLFATGQRVKRRIRARALPTRRELLSVMTTPAAPAEALPYSERRRRGLGRSIGRLRSIELDMAGVMAAGLQSRPLVLPAVQRLQRRRAYYFRHLQLSPATAEPAAHMEMEKVQVREEERPAGGAADEVADSGAVPMARRRPSVYDRSYKVARRLQYTDRMKSIVRKAGLLRRGGPAAATVAASVAAAAATGGAAESAVHRSGAAAAAGARRDPESDAAEDEGDGDPRGEYNPAAEVVNDVYAEVMGKRLPERAMYGKRAEALAAMKPRTVKEQCKVWQEACGKDYALAFHAKEPLLLPQSPQTLLLTLEHLATHLGLPPDACVKLVLRCPGLVGMRAEQLSGTIEAVSEALEIGLQEAAGILSKAPVLALRQPVLPVSQRVALLGALLPVSRDKLRQVLRSRPELLSKSIMKVAAFMMSLSSSLGLPLFDVSLIIAGCPSIVSFSATRISSRWAALQSVTARHQAWRQQLQDMAPPSLGRCLVTSEAAIDRLETILDRGLTEHTAFASFRDVLTMSGSRFEALASGSSSSSSSPAAQQHQLGERPEHHSQQEKPRRGRGRRAGRGSSGPDAATGASDDHANALLAASPQSPPPPAAVVAAPVAAAVAAGLPIAGSGLPSGAPAVPQPQLQSTAV